MNLLLNHGQKKFYLKNEVHVFLNLIETIQRLRDFRCFLCGNAISITNPYFLYFDIDLPKNSDIKLYKDGLILVNFMKNLKYRDIKKNTKFGKLTSNTPYSNYAFDNSFIDVNNSFIEKKKSSSKFSFAFIYQNQTFGVWIDNKLGKIFISSDYIKDTPYLFSTTLDNHKENTLFLKSARRYNCWRVFIDNYMIGNLRFENVKIKSICQSLIKSIILN